jgi:RNA polymerase sigma factor (sigma-70 family)
MVLSWFRLVDRTPEPNEGAPTRLIHPAPRKLENREVFGEERPIAWLVKQARRGDSGAWEAIVKRYERLVWSVLGRYGIREEDRQDAFQTTFVALFKSLSTIENPETLPKWLAVTAAREARHLAVKGSRVKENLDDFTEQLRDGAFSPEDVAAQTEEAAAVHSGLDKMDTRCKDLLTRSFIQEQEYGEISREMGLPIGSIGPTRARCLEKLRKILTSMGFGDVSEAAGATS